MGWFDFLSASTESNAGVTYPAPVANDPLAFNNPTGSNYYQSTPAVSSVPGMGGQQGMGWQDILKALVKSGGSAQQSRAPQGGGFVGGMNPNINTNVPFYTLPQPAPQQKKQQGSSDAQDINDVMEIASFFG